ncbi:MAG: DUF3391 domain-containing protein [Neptuniibacter sp.]
MERIKTSDLKEGMYVDLGKGWLKHPFLRRAFMLKDQEQINKIRDYLNFVSYCPERSKVLAKSSAPEPELEPELPPEIEISVADEELQFEPPSEETWEEINKPTEKLAAAIQSDQEPEKKA